MSGADPGLFTTFGDLLKYLRQRARLTQRQLGVAVGYSDAQITRLENGQRLPDPTAVRARFLDVLDLKDEPSLAQRLLELSTGPNKAAEDVTKPAPNTTPPARSAQQTNLPAQLTRFIGREHEIAAVTELVSAYRMVTLTGAGGVGKTRLALEVGAVMHSATVPPFPDGVWLVELAPLSDPAGAPRAVAEALRLSDEVGRTLTAIIIERLAESHLLLLLDNCEHVIGACAELVEALLENCPGIHILTTSREPLQAAGEVTWRVPSLTTPAADSLPPFVQLAGYAAVRLFVMRASAAHPEFQLTPKNAVTVAQICMHLDGIPLAIKMAAAQAGSMAIQEIAVRLGERFTLLVNPRRTALPRQRTLQATLEWSFQLLSEPEQVLLARLSAFADGCTAEMARAVCADSADILPLLLRLVRKSLVVANTLGERTRYHLLETVRQFAAEKLAEHGETDAVYRRLAAYLISLPIKPEFPMGEWVQSILAEMGNIRSVIAWAHTQNGGFEIVLKLATNITGFGAEQANLAEPMIWLEEGLAYGEAIPADLRVVALLSKLNMLMFAGYSLGPLQAVADELATLSGQYVSDLQKNIALFLPGVAAASRGDLDKAGRMFERLQVQARQQSYWHWIAVSLVHLGLVRVARSDHDGAVTFFNQAIQVGREAGDRYLTLLGLSGMVWADRPQAIERIKAELSESQQVEDDLTYHEALLQECVQVLMLNGEYAQAAICAQQSLDLSRVKNLVWAHAWGTAEALLELGRIAWLEDDPATARTYGEQCLNLYQRVGDMEHVAQAHTLLGYAALTQHDLHAAANSLRHGITIFRELNQPAGTVVALAGMAALAEAGGNAERAARLYGAADVPHESMIIWMTSAIWSVRAASRVIYDRLIAVARTRYEGTKHATEWATGKQMTLDKAVEYALQGGEGDEPSVRPPASTVSGT